MEIDNTERTMQWHKFDHMSEIPLSRLILVVSPQQHYRSLTTEFALNGLVYRPHQRAHADFFLENG